MRRLVPVLGVLALAVLWPAPASAAEARIELSATHGQASAEFTATWYGPTVWGICQVSGDVEFKWDDASLGKVRISGCKGVKKITPPAGKNGVGEHQVTGGTNHARTAIYTIDPKPLPTPKPPSPTPKPTPAPTAKPPATPKPPTDPKPTKQSPTPLVPSATANLVSVPPVVLPTGPEVPCAPVETPRIEAGGELLPVNIPVESVKPSSLLPAIVDFTGMPAMMLTVPVGDSLKAVQDAMASGTAFPCVQLNLGPTDSYKFASYALRNVGVRAVEIEAEARITLTYTSATWRYQLVDSDEVVTGGVGVPTAKSSGTNVFSIAMYAIAGALVLGGGIAFWVLRQRTSTR